MANSEIVEISIRTAEELVSFFDSSMNNYADYNVIIENDIDMINYGVITKTTKKATGSTQNNITIDLNGHTIKNIYPVFVPFIEISGYQLTIKNGYITNCLINTGSMINITSLFYQPTFSTFKSIFSSVNDTTDHYNSIYSLKFENVGFSILGCNFYDTAIECATILQYKHSTSFYSFLPAMLFKSCSFYIRAYNYEPATNDAVYMNCSFYYDVEYKKIDFYIQNSSDFYHRNNMYCFCTFNGKIKKSPDYVDVSGNETIIGYMYNSYFDVETDIEKPLFIACNVDKTVYTYYRDFHQDSYGTSTDGKDFDATTVYNSEKYLPEIVEGKNCCPVLGATALSDAEMHDTEKLLEIGLLAIDASGDGV